MSKIFYTLTEEQALEIRRLYLEGVQGQGAIGARFGVPVDIVRKVVRGEHSSAKGLPNITRGRANKRRAWATGFWDRGHPHPDER